MSSPAPDQKRLKTMHANPCAIWDFTFFHGDMDPETFITHLQRLFKKWVFQREIAPTTGRSHFQGRGSLFKKKRFVELCALLNETDLKGMDVSESSNNSKVLEVFYSMKDDTRAEGPWDNRMAGPVYVPRQYYGMELCLRDWQLEIRNSRLNFNSRTINYIYDPTGGLGKTTVAAVCSLHDKGIRLPPINDAQLLLATVCDILTARDERKPGCLFIDLPRYMKKDKMYGIYSAIEEIKNGHVYDLRYAYKEWWFDSPPVWVFSNVEPVTEAMSMDRWRIWQIKTDVSGNQVFVPSVFA